MLFFGFTKDIPFTHGFQIKAQFESANSIRPNSPVRIAGVEVGKVKSVEGVEGSNAALLTMELNDSALPLHADATAKVRPRIFLEGNFFVDLKPGTPAAPTLDSGDTIKISQTASPVQLDEVLTSLQSDSREDLKALLTGLNTAFNSEDASGDSASQSFNRALDDIPEAEKSTAQVLEATLGTEPGRDVARLIRGTANTADELDRYESELKDLITNLNLTTATFASESANLRATIRELAPTLASANAAFTSLNAAFPPTRQFARDLRPGRARDAGDDRGRVPVDRADPRAGRQGRARRAGGGALAGDDGPREADRPRHRAPAADRPRVQVPARRRPARRRPRHQRRVHDRRGELQGVLLRAGRDRGRGPEHRRQRHVRALPDRRRLADGLARLPDARAPAQLFGNNVQVPLGNRPAYPGKRPPYKPDEPCYRQKIPDVNGPAAAKSLPTASAADTAQVKSVRDKLRREANLGAVRKKLNPFGTAKKTNPAAENAK